MPDIQKIDGRLKETLKKPEDALSQDKGDVEKGEARKEATVERQYEGIKISGEKFTREKGAIQPGVMPAYFTLGEEQKKQRKQVEKILSEGLEEIYLKMTPEKQREFKLVGEETTAQIIKLLNQTKLKVKKIIDLIKKWLSLIPGVNKFFLEQEAKIKADEIIKLKQGK